MTRRIFVINIKKLKIRRHVSAQCAIIRPKPIVLVHSVGAFTMGSHSVYKIILTFKIKFYSVSRCI